MQPQKHKNEYLKVFLLAALCATVIFLPFVIADKGLFLFYGDYNVQQIPFYKLAHEAVRSGNIRWNFGTDLGVNFIGSYSFYLLGSPFFWLTLPFPTAWVPYLMAPLFVLKFSVSAVTAYGFIRRFTKSNEYAQIGAFLYAFSGFAVYNVFFNHFNDVIAFFPLLLIALEEYIVNRRRCVFALTVALMATINYFFFAGQVIFLVLYFLARSTEQDFKYKLKQFFGLAFESLLGVALSAFIFLPAALAVLSNPRVDAHLWGWDFLTYPNVQRYLLILHSFFFPPDIPARPNFFPDSDAKWGSVAALLPLFGMTGVIAYIKDKSKNAFKYILVTCFIMAFIPGLNSAFYAFNNSYYARWFYMLILIMALCTALSLEDQKSSMLSGLKWSAAIVAAFTVIGILPGFGDSSTSSDSSLHTRFFESDTAQLVCAAIVLLLAVVLVVLFARRICKRKGSPTVSFTGICITLFTAVTIILFLREEYAGDTLNWFNLPPFPSRFWISVIIAVLSLVAVFLLLKFLRGNRYFAHAALAGVCIISVLFSLVFIASGKTHSYTYNQVVGMGLNAEFDLPEEETGMYRVDVFDGMDNYPMFWGLPTIQAFHSIVPDSVTEFYESMDIDRGVATRPDISYHGLRGLTSVKYLFYAESSEETPFLPGFTFYDRQNGFIILQNDYYVPMGFVYDNYITEEQYDYCDASSRDMLLMHGMLLTDEQIAKYGATMHAAEDDEIDYLDDQAYLELCTAHAEKAVSSFKQTSDGFTATITASKEALVYLSVPYDAGFTATVDGKPVEIEKVNKGFCAVPVSAGSHRITFVYRTPGLTAGIAISGVALLILLLYALVWRMLCRKKPQVYAVLPNRHRTATVRLDVIPAQQAYVEALREHVAEASQADLPTATGMDTDAGATFPESDDAE